MSWKHTHGILASGPPSSTLPPSTSAASSSSSSSSLPVGQRIRPNSNLQTPYQRETAFAKHYGVDKDALATEERNRKSEWDVVREHHRFVRDGDDDANGATTSATTWEERVARSYESKLFKEFALIDLKHYKSKRLALRWRTAPEVISGIGESTCASLRCQYHQPPQASSSAPGAGAAPLTASNLRFRDPDDIDAESSVRSSTRHTRRGRDRVDLDLDLDLDEIERVMPPLRSFELPFVYAEAGQRKETLVKVRLCPSCQRKLTWKPDSASTSNAKSGSILDDRGTAERRGEKKVRSSRESERERDRRRSKGKGRVSSEEDSESESESEGGARLKRDDTYKHRRRGKCTDDEREKDERRNGDRSYRRTVNEFRDRDRDRTGEKDPDRDRYQDKSGTGDGSQYEDRSRTVRDRSHDERVYEDRRSERERSPRRTSSSRRYI
ncbi:hypothetical protein I316_06465 [Kwoniella heveanensis BCC8398]|uniref:Protein FRA10AC1 n=1 Tax=Kwoniella heveanensis BCC8398 TaxID=1296120 RepID=A0A1B9GLH9_9TREE|nr:hypothetical protein I316_06465 [Kwoniella heveanensis BCC8398]